MEAKEAWLVPKLFLFTKIFFPRSSTPLGNAERTLLTEVFHCFDDCMRTIDNLSKSSVVLTHPKRLISIFAVKLVIISKAEVRSTVAKVVDTLVKEGDSVGETVFWMK